jgi:hypothetical protein
MTEEEEFKEYEIYLKRKEKIENLMEEYRAFTQYLAWPPMNLNINYYPFTDEVLKALQKMNGQKNPPEDTFSKIADKFKKEISSVMENMEKFKDPKDAIVDYLKKNPTVNYKDFQNTKGL